jgi:hypothetical protein
LTTVDKRCLYLYTGSNECVGFIVDAGRVDIMIAMAKDAGIQARLEAY